jgi:hypothetical protein
MAAVGMSGAIPLLLPYAFMAWTGSTLPSTLTKVCLFCAAVVGSLFCAAVVGSLFCAAVAGSLFYSILSVWTV